MDGELMRALLFVIALLVSEGANAQMLQAIVNDVHHSGGGGYTGVGDIKPGAARWYGLRCYKASQAGLTQAINIRRASDNTTQDIGFTGACGLDIASANTFCTSTTCFIHIFYALDVNGANATQATNGSQAQLIFSCNGSLPCARFTGGQSYDVAIGSQSIPFTYSIVVSRTANFTTVQNSWSANAGASAGWAASTNTITMYAGSAVTATASDSTLHAIQFLFNGASSTFTVDGITSSTVNPGTGTTTTPLGLGHDPTFGNPASMDFEEGGFYVSGFSGSDLTSVSHNQCTYWNTPTAC